MLIKLTLELCTLEPTSVNDALAPASPVDTKANQQLCGIDLRDGLGLNATMVGTALIVLALGVLFPKIVWNN